jgi:hypothetical protein
MKKLLMKKHWIIPTAFISLNFLIVVLGLATNSDSIGSFAGTSLAKITDPTIIVLGVLIGLFAFNFEIRKFFLILFSGVLISVLVFYLITNTSSSMNMLIILNSILLIASVIFLIIRLFELR